MTDTLTPSFPPIYPINNNINNTISLLQPPPQQQQQPATQLKTSTATTEPSSSSSASSSALSSHHLNAPTTDQLSTTYSKNLSSNPSSQQPSPIVSCVVCIDASIRAQLTWKTYGSQYLLSYLRTVQLLYSNATYRITPIFFTSLPPSVPANQSVTQPFPFLDLNQFTVILPDLLPLKRSSNPNILDIHADFDYGGDDPAILDAIIRALELLDRKPTSNAHPIRPRSQPQLDSTQPIHHKHILIVTSTDIGPPGMVFNPNKPICFDPSVEELPRTVPLLNQKAEYDGITFQDLTGRFTKDSQGKWNFYDKQIGLLEKKSIILGLISAARTPRLLSFIGRHLGPFVFHAVRQQNLISVLNKSHSVIISGFTDIHSTSNKRPAAALSHIPSSIPYSSNTPLGTSIISGDQTSKAIQESDLQPLPKRPRIQANDGNPSTALSSNPFSISDSSAPASSNKVPSSNGGSALAFPTIIQPQDKRATSADHQRALSLLSSSNPSISASTQLDHTLNITDSSLAQGLSFLAGAHKTTPVPQINVSSASNPQSNLLVGQGSNRPQLLPGVPSSTQIPPNDALSQALALLGGVSGLGATSVLPPVSNISAPSNVPKNHLPTSQAQSGTIQKSSQPSPHDQQLTPYASQTTHPHVQPDSIHPSVTSKPQQAFQPHQIQPKQQHQLQQLQQLQESHKMQQQHANSQRHHHSSNLPAHLPASQPESSSPSNFMPRSHQQAPGIGTSQAPHPLLPAASIGLNQQPPQQVSRPLSQQLNANPNSGGRSITRAFVESAQARAREQLRIIEAKFKRGEITEEDAKTLSGKIKMAITDALRTYAVNAAKAKSQANGGEPAVLTGSIPPPNISPPSLSDASIAWQGRLIWSVTIPGSGNGHEPQKKELSIPIGAVPCSGASDLTYVESWPKIWRVDGMRQTNMVELSQKSNFEKPFGVAIHLLNEPPSVSNGGLSNEDIYTKFCECLGVNHTSVAPFDDLGHGAVLLYNKTSRVLFGIIFRKTLIPYHLFQGPMPPAPSTSTSSSVNTNTSTSIVRPNSSASSSRGAGGGIGSPNLLNSIPNNSTANLPLTQLSLQQPSNLTSNPNINQKQQFIQQVLAQQHRSQLLSQQQQSTTNANSTTTLNPYHTQQLLHNLSTSFNPSNTNPQQLTNHNHNTPW